MEKYKVRKNEEIQLIKEKTKNTLEESQLELLKLRDEAKNVLNSFSNYVNRSKEN